MLENLDRKREENRKFGNSEFSPFNKKGDTKYCPNCGEKSEDDEDDGI